MRLMNLTLTSLIVFAATGLSAGCSSTAPTAEQFESVDFGLSWENFDDWRAHLVAENEPWLEIPWHATYRDGLLAASEANRPILLWVMNGHPLGPT